jgi:hypothetical protein
LTRSRIFISYRRADAAGDAGRLADHLQRRFGAERLFLDVDTIEPGADFVRVLRESLQQTVAMLVVIGTSWTSLRDPDGTRRIDNPNDFVRLEVEGALGSDIAVVPVLVQGASLPKPEELPASLRPLLGRQVAAIDHAEFHADAERLCTWLAKQIERDESPVRALLWRWRPAAALVVILALATAGYRVLRPAAPAPTTAPSTVEDSTPSSTGSARGDTPSTINAPVVNRAEQVERTRQADALLAEASMQQRRNQFVEALATLARARELAPNSAAVRRLQEDVAMTWIRNVRVESGKSTFGEAIKPALTVIDRALPSATGERRADLLAHSGWATFLLWRDGDRQLDPAASYQQALAIDALNPYANAMLAHWTLFRGDDVGRASTLFSTALRSGRAVEAVRTLQWAAYGNSSTPAAAVERVRLADAMRRAGERLNETQAQTLWSVYYFALPKSRQRERQALLEAVAPDDHISTLTWAFADYAATDPSRQRTVRYYVALLDAAAGRTDKAAANLRALQREIGGDAGSLRDAVQLAVDQVATGGHTRP